MTDCVVPVTGQRPYLPTYVLKSSRAALILKVPLLSTFSPAGIGYPVTAHASDWLPHFSHFRAPAYMSTPQFAQERIYNARHQGKHGHTRANPAKLRNHGKTYAVDLPTNQAHT